jgi:dolichyl-diphosphooligosaccharide--protein glycosyltransferase
MGVGLAIAILAPKPGIFYLFSIENLAVLGLVIIQLIYWWLRERYDKGYARLSLVGLSLLVLLSFFILPSIGVGTPLKGKFLYILNPLQGTENPLYESVAEHRLASWGSLFTDFGGTLILGLLGCYFALQEPRGRKLYVLIFYLTGIYFAGIMNRLALILSIPVVLMAGYGLVELMAPLKRGISGRIDVDIRKRKRLTILPNRGISIIFIIILFIGVLPQVWGSVNSADLPTSLAASSLPIQFELGKYPQDWLQALSWMSDNLPDDAIVVSWWDYGYWIEALANKTTLADGATINRNQIANIAKMMMLPPEESISLFQKYNATHVLVFITYDPGTGQSIPVGDNVKWHWMVRIGGFNESDFDPIYDPNTGQTVPTDNFTNSTINGLLTGRYDEVRFEPVFFSEYAFVRIYRILY